jgi:hypothetical protein
MLVDAAVAALEAVQLHSCGRKSPVRDREAGRAARAEVGDGRRRDRFRRLSVGACSGRCGGGLERSGRRRSQADRIDPQRLYATVTILSVSSPSSSNGRSRSACSSRGSTWSARIACGLRPKLPDADVLKRIYWELRRAARRLDVAPDSGGPEPAVLRNEGGVEVDELSRLVVRVRFFTAKMSVSHCNALCVSMRERFRVDYWA